MNLHDEQTTHQTELNFSALTDSDLLDVMNDYGYEFDNADPFYLHFRKSGKIVFSQLAGETPKTFLRRCARLVLKKETLHA